MSVIPSKFLKIRKIRRGGHGEGRVDKKTMEFHHDLKPLDRGKLGQPSPKTKPPPILRSPSYGNNLVQERRDTSDNIQPISGADLKMNGISMDAENGEGVSLQPPPPLPLLLHCEGTENFTAACSAISKDTSMINYQPFESLSLYDDRGDSFTFKSKDRPNNGRGGDLSIENVAESDGLECPSAGSFHECPRKNCNLLFNAVEDSGDESEERCIVSAAAFSSKPHYPNYSHGHCHCYRTGGKHTIPHHVRFQRIYACKTVLTNHIKKGQIGELLNEMSVMRTLDHPYILRLFEVYQVKRECCVMDGPNVAAVGYIMPVTSELINICTFF